MNVPKYDCIDETDDNGKPVIHVTGIEDERLFALMAERLRQRFGAFPRPGIIVVPEASYEEICEAVRDIE